MEVLFQYLRELVQNRIICANLRHIIMKRFDPFDHLKLWRRHRVIIEGPSQNFLKKLCGGHENVFVSHGKPSPRHTNHESLITLILATVPVSWHNVPPGYTNRLVTRFYKIKTIIIFIENISTKIQYYIHVQVAIWPLEQAYSVVDTFYKA